MTPMFVQGKSHLLEPKQLGTSVDTGIAISVRRPKARADTVRHQALSTALIWHLFIDP